MTGKLRIILYLVFASVFGAVLIFAMAGLPEFGKYRGPYGDLVMQTTLPLRHSPQGVAAVTFDYRGFDTLGEEFILFAAVAGALLLMRPQQAEKVVEPEDQAADRAIPEPWVAVMGTGLLMFPFTLLLGIYIVLHGHLTPGGGFQGGVLIASAFYFVYLSGDFEDLVAYVEGHAASFLELAGAAGFALLAAIPLFREEPFMLNMLPLGEPGELVSSGLLPLFNCCVGTEVGAGFVLLIAAFLRQVLTIRRSKPT